MTSDRLASSSLLLSTVVVQRCLTRRTIRAFSQHVASYIRYGFGISRVVNPLLLRHLYMLDLAVGVTVSECCNDDGARKKIESCPCQNVKKVDDTSIHFDTVRH